MEEKSYSIQIMRKMADGSGSKINAKEVLIVCNNKKEIWVSPGYRTRTTVKVKKWDELKSVIIFDYGNEGRRYDVSVSDSVIRTLKANPRDNDYGYSDILYLSDSRRIMRLEFYAEVYENSSTKKVVPTYGSVDYQIDYKDKGELKKIPGKTSPVDELTYNHTYTEKVPIIFGTNYRIYLRNGSKLINPYLKGQNSAKPLILKIPNKAELAKDSWKKQAYTYIKRYQLQTFLQFRVKRSDRKSVQNVKIQLLSHANKVVKTLTVRADGLTDKIASDYKRNVKVLLDGKHIPNAKLMNRRADKEATPRVEDYIYNIVIPISTATTVPSASKSKNEVTLAAKTDLPIVFDLETQELILLQPKDLLKLKKEGSQLSKLIEECHTKRRELSKCLEPSSDTTVQNIIDLEREIREKEDLVKSKLNKDLKQKADIKEIYTTQRYIENGKTKIKLDRYHLNRNNYKQYYENRVNKDATKIDIRSSKRNGPLESHPKNLDKNALFKSLTELKGKASFTNYGKLVIKDADYLNELLGLSVNELSKKIIESEEYDVNISAQWLRAVGGSSYGVTGKFDPKNGNISAEAGFDVSKKFVLCEANINTRRAVPCLEGWQLMFNHPATGEVDLGAIRFIVQCDLYGFAGAKIGAAGAVAVHVKGNRQVIEATSKETSLSASDMFGSVGTVNKPKFDPLLDAEKFDDAPVKAGADIGINAFAGVEAGITPGGSIEWLNPNTKKFKAFATVSATAAGSFGIGVAACLVIQYESGKFMVKTKAALCYGIGAKGEASFSVNAKLILEFIAWVHHQLLQAQFRMLSYIAEGAFGQLSQLMVLMIGSDNPVSEILNNIQEGFTRFNTSLKQAQKRTELAKAIVFKRDSDWLKFATPETKGILLYNLTRHGPTDKLIVELDEATINREYIDIDFLPKRKEAIIAIFETVKIKNEWLNVLQHMHPLGEKSKLGINEGDIIRFLNYGMLMANEKSVLNHVNSGSNRKIKTGSRYVDLYLEMRRKVQPQSEYPKGTEIVKNTDPRYDIYIKHGNTNQYIAATNPEQYDPAGFGDNTSNPMLGNNNDIYQA